MTSHVDFGSPNYAGQSSKQYNSYIMTQIPRLWQQVLVLSTFENQRRIMKLFNMIIVAAFAQNATVQEPQTVNQVPQVTNQVA